MTFPVGLMHDYLKSVDLQQKWRQQKQNQQNTLKKNSAFAIDPLLKQIEKSRMEIATSKLSLGQGLSASEMEYLRCNNPELYAKAEKIAREREDYKRQLKRCKTKDEVHRTRMRKMAAFLSEFRIARDCGSGSDVADIQTRLSHNSDEHVNFINSPEYQKLPWESEELAKKRRKRKIGLNQDNRKEFYKEDVLKLLKYEHIKKTYAQACPLKKDKSLSAGTKTQVIGERGGNQAEIQDERAITIKKDAQKQNVSHSKRRISIKV